MDVTGMPVVRAVADIGGPKAGGTLPRRVTIVAPCLAVLLLVVARHTLVADRWPRHGHLFLDVVLTLATLTFAIAMVTSIERRHRCVLAQARELATHEAVLAERDRIAREMHDSLAQALGAAHLRIHTIGAHPDVRNSPRVAAELADVATLCEEAYADVREAILGLRTTGGPDRTLTQALDGYLTSWSRRAGIPARLLAHTDAADSIPLHAQSHVLRLVQEALTNTRKHADAHAVEVQISEADGRLRLSVADDGRGFDPRCPHEERYGLATMAERAHLVHGVVTLDTAPGRGTRVTLDLPVNAPAPANS